MSKNKNYDNHHEAQKIIPKEVRDVWQDRCDSATLRFQKFAYIKTDKTDIKADIKIAVENFCKDAENCKSKISEVMLPNIPGMISFTAVNKGRLLVNHTGGILECNLALHRFFNCPIISGSAIKGIARNVGRSEKDKERFSRVFGGEEKGKDGEAGSVAFLMAFPVDKKWKLVPDVLTSHGGSDTKNLVLVFFPAIEVGATFRFAIAPTVRTQDGDLEFAANCLKKALSENGVGAKTAAGYGWFEIIKELSCDERIEEWGVNDLHEHLNEVIASNNIDLQRKYVSKMLSLKAKRSLLRKWREKNNPNFNKFVDLTEKCGMELTV